MCKKGDLVKLLELSPITYVVTDVCDKHKFPFVRLKRCGTDLYFAVNFSQPLYIVH